MTVNVELYVLQNLAANLPILWAAARVCGRRVRVWRIALGALLGAGYAVAAYLPGLSFLQSVAARLCVSAGMGALAVGVSSPAACGKAALFVWLATFLFGGAGFSLAHWLGAHGAPLSPILLCCGMAIGACALTFALRGHNAADGASLCDVRWTYRGKTVSAVALADNGNRLREPISGLPVLVAGPALASCLELSDAPDAQTAVTNGFRMVPYAAVGGRGVLPALRMDGADVTLRGKTRRIGPHYVALSPHALHEDDSWQVLVPGSILREGL